MEFFFVLLIILGVGCLLRLAYLPQKENEASGKVAAINGIEDMFHGYLALTKKYKLSDSGIILSWQKNDIGYDIFAELTVHKMDGEDAAEKVRVLRNVIAYVKENSRRASIDAGEDQISAWEKAAKAKDQAILDFYGTDRLQGSFWDIDDCDFVENRFLRFEGKTFCPRDYSIGATIEAIKEMAKRYDQNITIEIIGNRIIRFKI